MAAPGGFDKALITDPYYRSTFRDGLDFKLGLDVTLAGYYWYWVAAT